MENNFDIVTSPFNIFKTRISEQMYSGLYKIFAVRASGNVGLHVCRTLCKALKIENGVMNMRSVYLAHFSTAILSLPLIQEGQLSVSGERMCTILVNRLED